MSRPVRSTGDATSSASGTPLLEVQGLGRVFAPPRSLWRRSSAPRGVTAVHDVSFALAAGESVGLVGASGSGKSTLSRLLLRLIDPTSGAVLLRGENVVAWDADTVRQRLRPAIRMVFQDPDAALNPAYSVGEGLRRALVLGGRVPTAELTSAARELLGRVGLPPTYVDKFPDELSGGEKRRLGICRALSSDPALIVADEPLSGLDVVLQERILALLAFEQRQRGFALLLVSHDLDRVHQACDRVLVMYAGRLVEDLRLREHRTAPSEVSGTASASEVGYRHPYAIALAAARDALLTPSPQPVGSAAEVVTDVTSGNRSAGGVGCGFRGSCARWRALGRPSVCAEVDPPLLAITPQQRVACHFADAM
jgi:peptide/nickel transport system ATP-binding protein